MSGTRGTHFENQNYSWPDTRNSPFSTTLQIATEHLTPKLNSMYFTVIGSEINAIGDFLTWIQDTASSLASELYLATADPGGASAPACASAGARLLVTGARIFTAIDTIAGVGKGIQEAHNLSTNSGNMTNWEIAGSVASIGLNFAPALGAAGGAALKKAIGPNFMKLGGCFVAGTPVHLSAMPMSSQDLAFAGIEFGFNREIEYLASDFAFNVSEPSIIPIEAVPLGARVGTKNPEAYDYDHSLPEVDRNSWSRISLVFYRDDGGIVDAELLRPDQWILDRGVYIGSRLPIHFEELEVHGYAEVINLSPCPEIAEGDGEVVIGRFRTRQVAKTIRVTMLDGTVLEGTPVHPIWSVDREAFIEMSQLLQGERLQTNVGPSPIDRIQIHNQPVPVYNIEVFGEHVYEVTDIGILVHNSEPCNVPISGVTQVLEASTSSWKKHGARLYADLKNVFRLDVRFPAKSVDAPRLVAIEYPKTHRIRGTEVQRLCQRYS